MDKELKRELKKAAEKSHEDSYMRKIAEEILYWIASERENEVYGDEDYNYEWGKDKNRYWLYTGNINYLIDFTSAYKEFIQDMIDNVKEECKVEDIECVEVRKQEIILKINGIETRIYVDDEWLKISFEEV